MDDPAGAMARRPCASSIAPEFTMSRGPCKRLAPMGKIVLLGESVGRD
jgi:hypothetical protein